MLRVNVAIWRLSEGDSQEWLFHEKDPSPFSFSEIWLKHPPPPSFSQVLILKGVEAVCFVAVLQVLIVKDLVTSDEWRVFEWKTRPLPHPPCFGERVRKRLKRKEMRFSRVQKSP